MFGKITFNSRALRPLAEVDPDLPVDEMLGLIAVVHLFCELPRFKGEPEDQVPPKTVAHLRSRVCWFVRSLNEAGLVEGELLTDSPVQ